LCFGQEVGEFGALAADVVVVAAVGGDDVRSILPSVMGLQEDRGSLWRSWVMWYKESSNTVKHVVRTLEVLGMSLVNSVVVVEVGGRHCSLDFPRKRSYGMTVTR
jgi:hypothetical protein